MDLWLLWTLRAVLAAPLEATPTTSPNQPAPAAPVAAPGEPGPIQLAINNATTLHVRSAGGDVEIRAKRGQQLVLRQKRTLGSSTCQASVQQHKQTLVVSVQDSAGKPCAIDIAVTLPPNMHAHVEQEEGNLLLSGLRGRLNLRLNHGNAVVGGTFAALKASLTQGSLSAQGLAGDGDINLDSGNVQIYFAHQAVGALQLGIVRGNATLIVDDSTVAIDAAMSLTRPAQVAAPQARAGDKADVRVAGHLDQGRLLVRSAHGG